MGFISDLFGTHNNYQANNTQANNPYTAAQLATAAQNQNANLQQQQALQQQQGALATQLQTQAAGGGPNPSLSQLQATTNQNNQAAAGNLASQRGLNPALAAKMAATNQAQSNQSAANQAATLRAQQQLAAQGQLQNLYGQQGQQLNSQFTGLTGQQQAYNQANLGNQAINANVAGQNASANGAAAGAGLGAIGSAFSMFGGGGGGGSDIPVTSVDAQGGMIKPPVKMADGGSVGNPYMDIVAYNSGLSPAITNAGGSYNSGSSNMKSGAMSAVSGAGKFFGSGGGGGSEAGSDGGMGANAGAADLTPTGNIAARGGVIHRMFTGGGLPDNRTPEQVQAGNTPGGVFTPAHTYPVGNETGPGAPGYSNHDFLGFSTNKDQVNGSPDTGFARVMDTAIPAAYSLAANAVAGPLGGLASNAFFNEAGKQGGLGTAKKAAKGGEIKATNTGDKLRSGGKVPGQASVKGNSYSNDTVHALLSPGEIVIPRSVTQGPDPVNNAAKFVAAVMAHQGLKGKKGSK